MNKFAALGLRIGATVIGFIILLAGIMFGLRLFFGLVEEIPFIVMIYMAMVLAFPTVFFISVYSYFIRRSRKHISRPVKIISITLMALAILSWIIIFCKDAITYFSKTNTEIDGYLSFEVYILAINVSLLFIIAIMQALTTAKEVDWRERRVNEKIL